MKTALRMSLALSSMLLLVRVAEAGAADPSQAASAGHTPSVVERTEGAVVRGVNAATRGVEHGAKAAAQGVEHGAQATARGVKRGAKAAAGGVERGVGAAARGVEHGAEATARTARRVSAKVVGETASSSAQVK